MQSLQARIDSFQKAKRIKRYPSKPSSSAASVKWPHPPDFKANANTLAEAGFFFSPSWDDRDSVSCFRCGKELSDWDESDDPFEIHYTKCRGSCAWAVVRCGLTEDLDNKGWYGGPMVHDPSTHFSTVSCSRTKRGYLLVKPWKRRDWKPLVKIGGPTTKNQVMVRRPSR